jgi:hypothetical protein
VFRRGRTGRAPCQGQPAVALLPGMVESSLCEGVVVWAHYTVEVRTTRKRESTKAQRRLPGILLLLPAGRTLSNVT